MGKISTVGYPMTARCLQCSAELSDSHVGPCPKCGRVGKDISFSLHNGVGVEDYLVWQSTKAYFRRHSVLLACVIFITFGAPFIGLFLAGIAGVLVGLLFSAISFLLGLKAVTRVIEREKEKIS